MSTLPLSIGFLLPPAEPGVDFVNQNNAAPPEQRGAALSVHVWHRRRRVIFAAQSEREPRRGFHLKAEKALTYLETTYHAFFTSPLYTFNEDM